jgi:hypothetical protein
MPSQEVQISSGTLGTGFPVRLTTGASALLTTLLTAASAPLPADVQELVLIPEPGAVDIRWNVGAAASATTALLPAAGLRLKMNYAALAAIRLYSDGAAYLSAIALRPKGV